MKRREYVAAAGVGATALAGCLGFGGGSGTPDTLRVGTYGAFVNAVSTSAGNWIKREFESRHDATLEWKTPDSELNYYIQRRNSGAPMDADVFVGVTPTDLVRADEKLGDTALFRAFDTGRLDNYDHVQTALDFDPQNRIVPTGTSYVCLVYDETSVDAPTTFDALATDQYDGSLILANPQSTVTGLDFLLWTINVYGEDGYLDYWRRLRDNDVTITGSWNEAYSAYGNGEAPMVVSYSTDQVYVYNEEQGHPDKLQERLKKHQVGFLNDQGYAYVDGMGMFATTDRTDLAHTFASFMLQPDVQQKIAVKNVGIPVVTNASLPEDFQQYVHVPDQPVQFTYDHLRGNVDTWRSDWAQAFRS